MQIPREIIDAAQHTQTKWKVPASVTIAQWALESNYGRAMPANSNNPFGIKASANQPHVTAHTREVIHGRSVYIDALFRKYGNLIEAFDDHGRLLGTVHVYAPALVAWSLHNDADQFADIIAQHYATDPHYATSLKKLMKMYDLYQYDHIPLTPDVPRAETFVPQTKGGDKPVRQNLHVGSVNEDVSYLNHILSNKLNFNLEPSDYFGTAMYNAVLEFQRDRGLKDDGIVGPKTWAEIDKVA